MEDKGKIITLTYLKNEQLGRQESDRRAIFDLYCETDTGEKFIVEMQKARQKYFKDRTLYYATFPIQAQAKKDIKNAKEKEKEVIWDYQLQGVYSIAVMDFRFEDGVVHKVKHDIMLQDITDHTLFYDKLRFIYLEMPNFTKRVEELTTHYEKWLYVLKNLSKLEAIPEKLKQSIFMKLFDTAEIANYDAQQLDQYKDSLKDYRDLKNSLSTAFDDGFGKGFGEGFGEGELKKAILVAQKAIQEGVSDEFIQKITDLSIQDIARIRAEMTL